VKEGRSRWRLVVGLIILTLATSAALILGGGNPALTLAPVAAALAVWLIWRVPLRYALLSLLLFALISDDLQEKPFLGMWNSPFRPLGALLYVNFRGLHFSALDVAVVCLFVVILHRNLRHGRMEGEGAGAKPLTIALLLSLAGILATEAWGLLRGGDFKNSLWQLRQLMYVPLLGLLFQYAFRGTRDWTAAGKVVLLAAVIKTGLGAYFLEAICRPQGFDPPYVTAHSDSMLFVAAMVIAVALWYERQTAASWIALGAVPVVWLGMTLNNRRLAWVALALTVITVFRLLRTTPLKRGAALLLLISLPGLAAYVVAGWSSKSSIARPVQIARSVIASDENASTEARDTENFNLYWTLRSNPLLGTGFGHEYTEFVKGEDISYIFAQYRYIPHNSLLGLVAFGGFVGFTLIMMPLVLGLYLAFRSYPRARRAKDRVAALAVVAIIVTYFIQAYGDMGLQSWEGTFLVGAALGIAGKLSSRVGAWPGSASGARPRGSQAEWIRTAREAG
jgi:O-antigen ligase